MLGPFRHSLVATGLLGILGLGTAPAAAQATFTVDVAPDSASAPRGGSVTYTVTVAPSGGAFAQNVTLSCLGDLAGATCSFDPASVTPDPSAETSTLTISTDVTQTPPGPLMFTVAGTSPGGSVAGIVTTLVVTDFVLTVNPEAQSVTGGTPAMYAVNLIPHLDGGSFDEAITLSCGPGLPPGSTCSFDPVTVTPQASAGASNLTVSTTPITAGVRRTLPNVAGGLNVPWTLAFAGVAVGMLLLGAMRLPRRDRSGLSPRWQLALVVAVTLLMGPACGSDEPTDPGPAPVNGVFDVIGTAGSLVRSMQVTITINP